MKQKTQTNNDSDNSSDVCETMKKIKHGNGEQYMETNYEIPGKGAGWEKETQSGTPKLVRRMAKNGAGITIQEIPFPSKESREAFLEESEATEHEYWY